AAGGGVRADHGGHGHRDRDRRGRTGADPRTGGGRPRAGHRAGSGAAGGAEPLPPVVPAGPDGGDRDHGGRARRAAARARHRPHGRVGGGDRCGPGEPRRPAARSRPLCTGPSRAGRGVALFGTRRPETSRPELAPALTSVGAFLVGWFLHAPEGGMRRATSGWAWMLPAAIVLTIAAFLTGWFALDAGSGMLVIAAAV